MDDEQGSWEKHTKGIGSKLLMKMGWKKGEGIGGGRANPIEVKMYDKQQGLRYTGKKNKEEPTVAQVKKPDTKPKRSKKTFKSVQQLIQDELVEEKPVVIIDMTGKDMRQLESMEQHFGPKFMPEITFNVTLLAEKSQDLVSQFARSLNQDIGKTLEIKNMMERNQEALTNLANDKRKLTEIKQKLVQLKQILVGQEQRELGQIIHPQVKELVVDITSYTLDLQKWKLPEVVVSLILPLVKKVYVDWEPLDNPLLGSSLMKEYKEMFKHMPRLKEKDEHGHNKEFMNPYEHLMSQIWFPPVRTCISNWNVFKPDPVIHFLEIWNPLLPDFLYISLVHNLILPKLKQQIQHLNPDSDSMHIWIYPWLPLLADELTDVYATIRYQITRILKDWTPSFKEGKKDLAYMLLEPWKSVWDKKEYDALLERVLIPKLNLVMEKVEINPSNQKIEPLMSILQYQPIVPPNLFHSIFIPQFFHKWLHVLYVWLTSPHKSSGFYDDISKWYSEWKSVFPESMTSDPLIKGQFTIALNMMNQSMSMQQIDHFADGIYASPIPPTTSIPFHSAPTPAHHNRTVTFKETLELFASKHNISFIPLNKVHGSTGKELFSFGKCTIYIDGTVVYLSPQSKNGKWRPIGLSELLELNG